MNTTKELPIQGAKRENAHINATHSRTLCHVATLNQVLIEVY